MNWKPAKTLAQRAFSGTVPNHGFITLVIDGRDDSPRVPVGIVYEVRDYDLCIDIVKSQFKWTAKKSGYGEVRVFCDDAGEEYLIMLPVGTLDPKDTVTVAGGSEKQVQIDNDIYLRAARF